MIFYRSTARKTTLWHRFCTTYVVLFIDKKHIPDICITDESVILIKFGLIQGVPNTKKG